MAGRSSGVIALIVVSCVMRVGGIFTDFWLDEIWSHSIAMTISSTPDVLLSDAARLDNNHPINTLLIRAMGERQSWVWYRIPSMIAGIGAVLLAVRIMSRRGRAEALAAAVFVGTSFPLVFYSSEARGYSLAVFFAMLALDALDREFAGARKAVMFNVACILGFLSHLTFLHFYAAAGVWTVLHLLRSKATPRQSARLLFRLHAIPLAAIVSLHLVFVRHLTIGGAPPTRTLNVLISALSLSVGGPGSGTVAALIAIIVATLFLVSLGWLIRNRSQMWVFYAVAVIIAPGLLMLYDLVLSERIQPLMVRYFLVALAMMLLALAQGAGALWRVRPGLVTTLLGLVVVGNMIDFIGFLSDGRGGYSRAVSHMLANTPGPRVTVAADNNFRVGKTLEFYSRLLPAGRSIDFDDGTIARAAPPMWLIKTSHPSVEPPPAVVVHASGIRYLLERAYPTSPLSGVEWYLYRIEPHPRASAP
ncbi:MAG: hypothetical protein ACREJC_04830 [Tepidisphaeraceae bacterium]